MLNRSPMRRRAPLALIFGALALVTLFGVREAAGQAVTTGTLSGAITAESDGSALPGVVVTAVHNPTGTTYQTTSRVNGGYTFVNVRVGGPYSVTADLDGFRSTQSNDVYVALGSERVVNFTLSAQVVEESITVISERPLIDLNQAGAVSNVSLEEINQIPTLDRSLEDIAKTSVYFNASGGAEGSDTTTLSISGRNNRYNTVQIDGAVNNDLFGLSPSGSPGGQAQAQPISLEAIQEVQLLVSPYDVRQGGFSGGGINAITKSGSNDIQGSVFFNTRDDGWVGDGPNDRPFATFSEDQYGGSLGGRLIRDKAFFFVSGELQRKDDPSGFSASSIGYEAEAARFRSILQNNYGYDPGSTAEFIRATNNDNYFVRFDFNLSDGSQLTARYNVVDAERDIGFPGSTFYPFPDQFYNIRPETKSFVAQWNKVFGGTYFNEARIGYTTVETTRDGPTRFPTVVVDEGPLRLVGGRERFSTANYLSQDILEINDDFTFVRGDHTITIGTHNELFSFENLFIRDNFGYYEFDSLDDFAAGISDRYEHSYSLTSNPRQASVFDVNQYGVYVGDQFRVRDNLTLTWGLRADQLSLPDSPTFNPEVQAIYGLRTNDVPDSNLVISPRIGFNWDPKSDGKQQLRGGLGIFSGRTPYVWVSNQYGNTGIEFQRLRGFGTFTFNPDPDNQPKTLGGSVTNEIALVDPDFEMPTVLRGNLAYDMELPYGIRGSAEVTYTQVQKDIQYKDLNLVRTGGTALGGRPEYTTISSAYNGVYFLTNTSDGNALTAGIELSQRSHGPFSWSFGYLYTDAEEIYPGTSSQASSNFVNVSVVDPQNPGLHPATYMNEHRFTGTLAYDFNIGSVGSTVSLYFNRQSGRPYSTTFNSSADVNGDGVRGNDLLYVPAGPDEIILQGATWDEFNAYISADDSLADARGRIVGANAGRGPWTTQVDLRWAFDLPISRYNVSITADILNLLNFIDSDKGVFQYVRFGEVSPVRYRGTDAATGKPIYDVQFTDPDDRWNTDDVRSRWQAKLGVRFRF